MSPGLDLLLEGFTYVKLGALLMLGAPLILQELRKSGKSLEIERSFIQIWSYLLIHVRVGRKLKLSGFNLKFLLVKNEIKLGEFRVNF